MLTPCLIENREAALHERLDTLASFNRHVAHDLRGPLVTIAAAAERAHQSLSSGDTEAALRMLGLLAGRALDLGRLVTELLALAEADEAALHPVPLDLTELAAHAIEEALGATHGAARAEVRLQPLPSACGVGVLLKQVFVNLIGNALKYSSHVERPVVEIGVTEEEGEPVIFVRDNGIGFDAAQVADLFKPFRRLHCEGFAGHGIGLSLVRRIVERHGGRVWALGNRPCGAEFRFTLAEMREPQTVRPAKRPCTHVQGLGCFG
jgi:signal transduction histidine kinase